MNVLSLHMLRVQWVAFALTACLLAATAGAATVNLSAPSSNAWVGVPMNITMEITDAKSHYAPHLPDVLNAEVRTRGKTRDRSSLSIINGRRTMSQNVTYTWTLTPRQTGPVTVPDFRVRIDGVEREVTGLNLTARVPVVGDRMALEIAHQASEVYVGQRVELTLELYIKAFTDERYGYAFTANDLFSLVDMQASRWGPFAATLNDPDLRGQQISADAVQRPDAQGELADYFRYRINTWVYPDRAGPLEFEGEGVSLVAQYPTEIQVGYDRFRRPEVTLTDARPVVVSAANPQVQVKPVPTAGRPDTYRGAVGSYRITAAADPLSVAAGDAVTLQLMVLNSGSGASPLDRLSAPPLDAITALTRDFDVTPGPIAGVLRSGAKVFTTTIRPRRADVTEIPPIPLVSFDPETQSFVTTQSDPIALAVRPAERLSLDGLTDGPLPADAGTPESSQDVASDGPQWLALPDVPPSRRARPWFWVALYLVVPAAAVLSRGIWWAIIRLGRAERTRASRAISRARRSLKRSKNPEGVAAALRRYAGDRSGRDPAALTAVDARTALAGCQTDLGADGLDRFANALRDAEAAACGAVSVPLEELIHRGRHAVDQFARRASRGRRGHIQAAIWLLLAAGTSHAQAPTTADAAAADHRAAAQRFEAEGPSTAALTNAATAWTLADQPVRARAAALAAVQYDPAGSAARAVLADAEVALGLSPAVTARFDRLSARTLGWGGRRLLMALGLAGLIGAGAWACIGGTWLGNVGWIRAVRPWKIGGSLVVAAAGACMAVHTAWTVPPPESALLLDADTAPRSGPGADFPAQNNPSFAPQRGELLHVLETRDGWTRSPDGWRPHDAVISLNTGTVSRHKPTAWPAAR